LVFAVAFNQDVPSPLIWTDQAWHKSARKQSITKATLCYSKAAFVYITLATEIKDSLVDYCMGLW